MIHRTLEEQSHGFGATDIELTNKKPTFALGNKTTTFYFDSFGSAKISGKKRKGHVVWIYDKATTPRFRVVVSTEANAKRFVDALYVLSLSVRTASGD